MNSWFTVKTKYTKQLEDGTFKRVTEPYLLAAMSFTDAEARIYEELGDIVRGEFIVTDISRTDLHDIFHYEDADTWYKCIITYEAGGDGGEEGAKAKKVSQTFLVTAHSVKDAYERLKESLGGMMIDYNIKSVVLSPLVDVFPFGDSDDFQVEYNTENTNPDIKIGVGFKGSGLKEIALSEGYTIYCGESEIPKDSEWVNVIFTDGQTNQIQFGNKDIGFDAEMRDGVSVFAWKSIKQYNENVKEHFRKSNSE